VGEAEPEAAQEDGGRAGRDNRTGEVQIHVPRTPPSPR
jgi:hypothetical protein